MGAMTFDWQDLAFGSKKQISSLKAVFIPAPREMSVKRFTQLVKTYLPEGNIILGLAKEPYIDGFSGQPQFKTLQYASVASVVNKVAKSGGKHQIYTLHYLQRELPFILEKLVVKMVVLVNGSWQHVFHASPAYYCLMKRGIPYQLVSPFCDEAEAKDYEKSHGNHMAIKPALYTDEEMMMLADDAATESYDYTFQLGVTLGKKNGSKYRYLLSAFNRVVPYQTYALHHGNSRETNFSPPNDLNHYDTIHAETYAVLQAQQQGLSLKGQTMFLSLLPCPTCARLLTLSDIVEFVYQADHSNGYAIKMLEAAGKKVRRLVL